MLQKLPIGIQTFSKIREDNYIYIDKTKEALDLITNYQYAFLSRPRRFGKSLFLDTLRNIFEGKKEYFKDLYIYNKWDWNTKYPVITFSFKTVTNTKELITDINSKLIMNQEKLNVKCEISDDYGVCFEELIRKVYQKYNQRVVVLIDEYDKGILDLIEKKEESIRAREILRRLYSVLKDSDEFIEFAFLTGVSKFSKASIFSGLNMLSDISLSHRFGNICGYTQEDLETSFKEHLKGADCKKVKQWYNGYYFLKDRVYNPFDLLKFIQNEFSFKNYWFASGTPTFLIKLIEQNNYFLPKLTNLKVGEELLDSFDIDNIRFEIILYQSGYLTIKEAIKTPFDTMEYKLKIPNVEVKMSFYTFIIETLYKQNPITYRTNLYTALLQGNLEEFKDTLINLFASIPYNNYSNNKIYEYEGFYASVIYSYLQSLGVEIIGEDVTNLGRIDLSVFIEDKIYIIEFKVVEEVEGRREKGEGSEKLKVKNEKQKSNSALEQIKAKKYYQKYQQQITNHKSLITLIGIEFCKSTKNICSFAWERV